MKPERPAFTAYPWSTTLTTRWSDNDVYGHINNVVYYSYFDSVANLFLVREGGLEVAASSVIGLVVESKCHYHAPLAYPQSLRAGLRVDKLGQRSVTYGIAIFGEDDDRAAAHGHFVHVFVDRVARTPVAIPEAMRAALERLVIS